MSQLKRKLQSLKRFFQDPEGLHQWLITLFKMLCVGLGLLCCMEVFAAGDTDLLASSASNVMRTFGKDSSLIKYVYVGETLMSGLGYAKTKNPLLLAGLPVLMIFTNVAFGMIEGA